MRWFQSLALGLVVVATSIPTYASSFEDEMQRLRRDEDAYNQKRITAERRFSEKRQKAVEGMRRLGSEACESEKVQNIKTDLDAAAGSADTFFITYKDSLRQFQRTGANALYQEVALLSVEMKLDFADQMLKKNCLDEADKQYRDIITKYIGALYQAFRERAKIGVDDVRAKRK